MVIRINDNNREKYNQFFKQAYADAVKEGINVPERENGAFQNLHEYFYYLPELGAKLPVYYTRLPLDEEMVDINGDTRVASVPTQLKICAGIENDHMAENIMFIVDRYHDSVDLMNANILIQWSANGPKGQVNGVVPIPANSRDIDYENQKIRFAWPLTSEVTQYPGIINFSAVFYITGSEDNQNGEIESTEICYRFGSLPAQIKIENALQKELVDSSLDVGSIFNKVVRKNNYGLGFYVPQIPTFDVGQYGLNLNTTSDLAYSSDTDKVGFLTLKAQATIGDTGKIVYGWKYSPSGLDGGLYFPCGEDVTVTLKAGTVLDEKDVEFLNIYGSATTVAPDIALENDLEVTYSFGTIGEEYAKIDKENTNQFDNYFKQTGNDYSPIYIDEIANYAGDVFEKYTTFILPNENVTQSVTGKYFAEAKNTVGETNDTINYKESEVRASAKTTLISPKDVEIKNQNAIEDVTFNVVKDNNGNILSKTAEFNTELTIVEGETYVPDWRISTESSSIDFNPEAENDVDITDFDTVTLNKDYTPGWYRANITAKRNREAKSEFTKIFRVLNPVEAPQIENRLTAGGTKSNDQENTTIVNTSDPTIELKVGILKDGEIVSVENYYGEIGNKDSLLSDSWTCLWYENVLESGWVERESSSQKSSFVINNAESTLEYKCVLENTLSGVTASSTHFFKII